MKRGDTVNRMPMSEEIFCMHQFERFPQLNVIIKPENYDLLKCRRAWRATRMKFTASHERNGINSYHENFKTRASGE